MINQKLTEETFEKLFQQAENKQCFECGAQSYKWASVNNAIFLCLQCSGIHRGLGVNVSFVRSVDMDTWSEKQLNMMLQGGNAKLKAYFDSYNIPKDAPIDFKYKTKAGIYYRDMLKCIVEGMPVPEQPQQEEALELVDFSNPNFNMQTQGMGSGIQDNEEEKLQGSDDPVEQMKGFFVSAFNKTKEVSQQAFHAASDAAHVAKEKADQKMSEPQVQEFKNKVVTGASEFGEKAQEVGKKGYEQLKSGLTSAWGFFKEKTNQFQNQQDNKNHNNNEENKKSNKEEDDYQLETNDLKYEKQ